MREPIDSTFYEPNIIVAPAHEALRPTGPEAYGVDKSDLSCEVRQGRNVVMTWAEAKRSSHPLAKDGYRFVFHTLKYRHGAHTTPIDTDMVAILFGPFGDIYRRDKRSPFVTEGYVDINPADAKALGVEDGDYVWIDSDPEDRPFRGWQKNKRERDFRHLAETVEKFHHDLCAPALLMHTKLQVLLTREDLHLSHEAEEVVRFAYERSREIQAIGKERLPLPSTR